MSLKHLGPIRFGDFLVVPQERLLKRDGKVVSIAPKAFDALLILTENAGTLIDRSALRKQLWPGTSFVEESNVARVIADVRKALGETGEQRRYIETVPKSGYRFIAAVEFDPPPDPGQAEPAPGEQTSAADGDAVPAPVPLRATAAWYRWGVVGILVVVLAAGVSSMRTGGNTRLQSLVVAPFQIIGGGPNAGDLQFGLQDSLTMELSGLAGLAVRAMKSGQLLSTFPDDAGEIGRYYRADAVLTGTVQLAAGRVKVSARLLRSANGQALWSGSFEEPQGDLFKIESSLAKHTAAQLLPALSTNERERLARRFPANAAAYRYYQLGRYYWNHRDEAAYTEALAMFRKAAEADPGYAPAYTGIADTYLLRASSADTGVRNQALADATAAIDKAIQINPDLGEAHATLGLIAESFEFDWDKAEREFRTAIRLAPSYATARHWYAEFLTMMGRFDSAAAEFEVARDLDPVSPIILVDLAQMYYFRREYTRSLETLDAALKLDPAFHLAHERKGYVWMSMRRPQEALAEFQIANRQAGRQPWVGLDAWAAAVAGRRQEAIVVAHRAEVDQPSYFLLGVIWAELGDYERAMNWTERVYQGRLSGVISLKVNPVFDALRDQPAFQTILRSMRLTNN